MSSEWLKTVDGWRCLYLLVSIVALLALYPYLLSRAWSNFLYDALFNAVMLFGLYSVARTRMQFFGLGLLLVPLLIGNWAEFGEGQRSAELALTAATAAFFFLLAGLVLRHVFIGRTRVGDRLCGALSVYLLLGLAFAQLYQLVYLAEPTAFAFAHPIESEVLLAPRFVYLSFVTQTTIGYGDITPRMMATESLTILQATMGVFYLAVLVAWLVGSVKPLRERG